MKLYRLIFLAILALAWVLPASAANKESEIIQRLQLQLKDGGIPGLIEGIRKERWGAPFIPSQWHVDNVALPESKATQAQARVFGKQLAEALATMAPKLRETASHDDLYRTTTDLLDLADWIATTEGYGNMLLEARLLDLASVEVARLVSDLTFDQAKCNGLTARFNANRFNAEIRRRVLNREVGVEMFPSSSNAQDTLDHVWASGFGLRLEAKKPEYREERLRNPSHYINVIETPEIKANLGFFEDASVIPKPGTLLNIWDVKLHNRFITGAFIPQNIKKVHALAEFRNVVGWFPEKPVFSAEQIRIRDQEIADAAKRGLKIVPFEAAFHSLREAAFDQAWRPTVARSPGMSVDEWNQRLNLSAPAWQAYEEVQRGDFLDHDTAETKLHTKPSQTKKEKGSGNMKAGKRGPCC